MKSYKREEWCNTCEQVTTHIISKNGRETLCNKCKGITTHKQSELDDTIKRAYEKGLISYQEYQLLTN